MVAKGSYVAEKRMRRLAEKHVRDQMNLDPDLYEFWHDTLITLLRKYDDAIDKELEAIWSSAIGKSKKMLADAY